MQTLMRCKEIDNWTINVVFVSHHNVYLKKGKTKYRNNVTILFYSVSICIDTEKSIFNYTRSNFTNLTKDERIKLDSCLKLHFDFYFEEVTSMQDSWAVAGSVPFHINLIWKKLFLNADKMQSNWQWLLETSRLILVFLFLSERVLGKKIRSNVTILFAFYFSLHW